MNGVGETNTDGLDEDIRDQMVAIGKGVISLVPFAGGPLAEIVGAVVPTQRADRIAAYLRALTKRIDAFEDATKNDLLSSKQKIDLIEEGGFQAARALSENRIEQIVEAVAAGISADEADLIRRKRLLVILGELDDNEVNLLNAYGRSYGGGDENAWDAVNMPEPTHMQSSRSEMDRDRLYEAGRAHLLRLGLTKKHYGNVKKGQLPDFDAGKGDFKHSVEIAYLGRLLLHEIGTPPPFDDDDDNQRSQPVFSFINADGPKMDFRSVTVAFKGRTFVHHGSGGTFSPRFQPFVLTKSDPGSRRLFSCSLRKLLFPLAIVQSKA